MEYCGKWLRLLHHMPWHEEVDHFDLKQDLQVINNILSRLAQYNIKRNLLEFINGFVCDEFYKIFSLLEEQDIVLLHQDFQTRNIFLTNGKIVPFDTLLDKKGIRYRDIGKFICSLRITKVRFLFDRTLFDHAVIKELENRFLLGYFGDKDFSRTLLNWYLLWAILQKWNQFHKIARFQGKLVPCKMISKLWINRIFEEEISRIVG